MKLNSFDRTRYTGKKKPNLKHGQDTRANRTRHTTSSSTQSAGTLTVLYSNVRPAR